MLPAAGSGRTFAPVFSNYMMFKKHIFLFLLLSLSLKAGAMDVYFSFAGKTIHLADSSSAAALILPPDAYTRELTPFDLSIRLNRDSAVMTDYLDTAAAQVRNWSPAEEQQLLSIFNALDVLVKDSGYSLPLPDTIHMIRSGTREEFGAEGYTRGNRILLNSNVLPLSRQLVAHELFHVISRLNPKWRDDIYGIFHFLPCNNIVYKPAMGNRVITNPDCPYLMHYIRAEVNGRKQDMALVLYSGSGYKQGNTINDYARLGLLALEGKGKKKHPVVQDGKALIYELDQVPDFFRQVGKNSAYILHIEELCAEHFAALCSGNTLPEPEYLNRMSTVLKRK
jgi:hypothetical protein